jgi:hypothetical protein
MIVTDVPFLLVATVGISFFYLCSQKEAYSNWKSRLIYLPMLMSIGIGLSVNNSKAVLGALFNRHTEFIRTPKYMIEKNKDKWLGKKYRVKINLSIIIELLLGVYFTFNIYFAFINKIYISIPFLMIFQVGFFYIAFLSLYQVLLSSLASSRIARIFISKRNTEDVIAA